MIFLEIDPNIVKPGWTPLLITIAIAAVMVFGFFSMRRQFRRINVPGDPGAPVGGIDDGIDPAPTDTVEPSSSGRTSSSRTPTSSASPPG